MTPLDDAAVVADVLLFAVALLLLLLLLALLDPVVLERCSRLVKVAEEDVDALDEVEVVLLLRVADSWLSGSDGRFDDMMLVLSELLLLLLFPLNVLLIEAIMEDGIEFLRGEVFTLMVLVGE